MILVGQDAAGAWAWMILDRSGRLVTSGAGLCDRFLAVDIAVAVYMGIARRGEADIEPRPAITFPDENPRP